MEALFTREAQRDLDLLRLDGPVAAMWGLLFGHRLGDTICVERLAPLGPVPVGDPSFLFRERAEASGRPVVGLFTQGRPPETDMSVLGPAFCGELYLEIGRAGSGEGLTCGLVDFDGRFLLSPVKTRFEHEER